MYFILALFIAAASVASCNDNIEIYQVNAEGINNKIVEDSNSNNNNDHLLNDDSHIMERIDGYEILIEESETCKTRVMELEKLLDEKSNCELEASDLFTVNVEFNDSKPQNDKDVVTDSVNCECKEVNLHDASLVESLRIDLEYTQRMLESATARAIAAEKNSSSLVLRTKMAMNEHNIAKLSLDQVELEFENAMQEHKEEVSKLRDEISSLRATTRKQSTEASKSCTQEETTTNYDRSKKCNFSSCVQSSTPESSSSESYTFSSIFVISHKFSDISMGVYNYIQPLFLRFFWYQFEVMFNVLWWYSDATQSTILPFIVSYIITPGIRIARTVLLPVIVDNVYPLYQNHLEQWVNRTYDSAYDWYLEHLDLHVDMYLWEPLDFLIGRFHYVAYFTVTYILDEDWHYRLSTLLDRVVGTVGEFCSELIESISTSQPLVAVFGDQASNVVYCIIFATSVLCLYLLRRVIKGVVALALVAMLFPSLLAIFIAAKSVSFFLSIFFRSKTKHKSRHKSKHGTTKTGRHLKGHSKGHSKESSRSRSREHLDHHAKAVQPENTKIEVAVDEHKISV